MRELGKRQVAGAMIRSAGFVPSVDGRLLKGFEQGSEHISFIFQVN